MLSLQLRLDQLQHQQSDFAQKGNWSIARQLSVPWSRLPRPLDQRLPISEDLVFQSPKSEFSEGY